MGFNMGLASVCVYVCVCVCVCVGGAEEVGVVKRKGVGAGRADTFCGEADGNVPSWETTTRVPSELSKVCK